MVQTVKKTIYTTFDGKEFETFNEALNYETITRNKAEQNFLAYKKTWDFQQIMKEHSLSDYGTWEVLGEDPNPDMGGPHRQPFLGFFEGKLEDVIKHAVMIEGFWSWGGGGSITQKTPPEVKKI